MVVFFFLSGMILLLVIKSQLEILGYETDSAKGHCVVSVCTLLWVHFRRKSLHCRKESIYCKSRLYRGGRCEFPMV